MKRIRTLKKKEGEQGLGKEDNLPSWSCKMITNHAIVESNY
jgi:hypothetical protein